MDVSLAITFRPEGGTPITIARTADRGLLREAARAAISEADRRAEEIAQEDAVFGELQRQESARIRKALETVVPELCGAAGVVM